MTIVANLLMFALVGIAATGVSTQASARTLSQRVSYADLDLASASGQKSLERRISRAVRMICGDGSSAVTAFDLADQRRCVGEAWASTRGQVRLAVARAEGIKRQQLASR